MVCVIVLRVGENDLDAGVLTPIRLMATRFRGQHRLVVSMPSGRELTLGPQWTYDPSEACLAALREFGAVDVLTDFAGGEGTGPFGAGLSNSPDVEADDG